jgi:serine/threonine-protein kinase RsbW
MERVIEEVLDEMAAVGYGERDVFGVRLSLDEAITNGLKHGNRNQPGRTVEVTWRVDAEAVLATVEDEGAGFDPLGVADPYSTEGLKRLSGRGVLLMRYFLSWLRYNERGNRVILCKYRTAS